MKKRCLYCNKVYEAKRKTTKYCSSRCRLSYFREHNKAHLKKYYADYRVKRGIKPINETVGIRKCPICGKEFKISSLQKTKRYCSVKCHRQSRRYKFYKSKGRHYERGCPLTERDAVFSDWLSILKKYEYRCVLCGSCEDLQVDMVVALSLGGTFTPENLQPLCGLCNRRKEVEELGYKKGKTSAL